MRSTTVLNRTDMDLDIERLREIFETVLKEQVRRTDAVLVFVDEDEISKLNESFRKMEGPTDVLTFKYDEEILGEVIVCPEYVKRNAEEFKVPFEEELIRVVVHGALHLSGYDHEFERESADEMFKKQEEYVKRFARSTR